MLVGTHTFDEAIVGCHRRGVYAGANPVATSTAVDTRDAHLEGAAAPTES